MYVGNDDRPSKGDRGEHPRATEELHGLSKWTQVHVADCFMRVQARHLGDLYAESGQTLQGSFSAVSKPNFASKYSLE